MKRKINLVGKNTLTVSLPQRWVKKHGIKKGNELNIEEKDNNLLVSVEEISTKLSMIEVKVDGLDKDSLIFLLRGLYLRGYDQIKFIFSDPYILHYRVNKKVTISSVIHKEVGICQGLDIIQERGDFIVMKNISVSSIKEFDTLLRRIFLLLIDTTHDLYIGAKNRDYALLETFQDKHDTITRLINYNLKILNTIGYSNYKNTLILSNILSLLDVVIDILKNIARDIIEVKMKIGSKALNVLNKIYESIKLYDSLFFNFSLDKTEKFVKSRTEIVNAIKENINDLSKDDMRVLVMAEHTLEILRDTYPSRMAMQY